MVKRFMRKMAGRPISKLDNRPQQERAVYAEINGSKAIFPSKEEVENNPKSRSARLRFLTKIKQPEL